MIAFTLRRLLSGAVLLAAISTGAFLLLYLGAGDIARELLGPTATEETVQLRREQLGLDRPVVEQYLDWVAHVITGDFGRSWFTSQPVADAIASRLSVTLSLVIGATVVSAVIAVVLGIVAARRGGWADRVVQIIAVLGDGVPNFLIAIALVNIFALGLGWFRPTGYVAPAADLGGWIATITLPVAAVSIAAIGAVAQQVRGAVIDCLQRDWVRTLRSRGLSERRIVLKHVLRNAGGPALAVLSLQFVGLVGGAVIIEQIFAIPGLGQVSVLATSQGDIPLVMGLVVTVGAIVVVVNLLIDLIQGFLNPKARLA